MTITGALLATITLQHDYYSDGRTRDFGIVPSAATAALLRGAGIRWKMVDNVFLLIIKVDEDGKPRVDLPNDALLSFYLTLESPSAANLTALPEAMEAAEEVFYLSNLDGAFVDGVAYLNTLPPAYAAAKMYARGDVVHDGSGKVFEAIKGGKGHGTGDAGYWQMRSGKVYADAGKTIPLMDGLVGVEVPVAAMVLESSIYGLNAATRAYDILLETKQQSFETPQTAAVLDLRHLPAGPYRIVTNGGEAFVYIDATASYSRVWGVIDIVTSFAAGTPFALIDTDGKPRGLDLVVRFASRMVKWKYNLRADAGYSITDSSGAISFQKVAAQPAYVSQKPLPLRDTPVKTIQLIKTEDGHDHVLRDHLPNPSPDFLSAITDGDGVSYECAELFLAN